jgi:tetratricopeptide (TPR) repeat protein
MKYYRSEPSGNDGAKSMQGARKLKTAVIAITVILLLGTCARDPQKAKTKYLAEGQKYMKKGQYGDASVEFRNALRLDPRFVDAYYQLAQADLAQRDWQGAYASLEKAIELDPGRIDARLDRGRLYLAAREFDKAEDEANSILQKEPKNVGAYQLLGGSLIGQQKPDRALESFSRVAELLPNEASSYVNLALIEISLHRPADAERHLKKALQIDPKSIQAYTDLANFYRLENRAPEAEQALQDGIAKNPTATSLYIEWEAMLTSQGKKDEAGALLDKLRKQSPNSGDAAMAIGDYYFKRKETDQALVEYRRGLSVDPKNVDIKARMQDLYLTTNQVKSAADLDRELMNSAPKDVFVRINHGRLLMAQGQPQDAIIYLQKVTSDAADSPQAHYYLAMAFWQDGGMGQARNALMDALKVSQGFPIALQALARLSLAQGNAPDAQIYAQELVQRFPAAADNRQLLAEALAQQGKLRPAEQQIFVARQLAPDDPTVHLDLAQIYNAEKKWPEAQEEFETALQLDPHNTTALTQMANFLTSRNKSDQALARVQQYVAANPNDANGHLTLGILSFQLKNYGISQAEFERAIQIDPDDIQAYLRLGKVLEEQGQSELAIARYQKALDLQPKLAPLATMIGNMYLDKGDMETARKYYSQALASDPNFAVAMANTAWVDAQEGKDLDVALGMAEKAKSLEPDVATITDTLAWVMYKRGNYANAMPLLQECVQKSPESAQFHYHLGMTLLASGQKAKGKEQLEAALRLNLNTANSEQARRALAQTN